MAVQLTPVEAEAAVVGVATAAAFAEEVGVAAPVLMVAIPPKLHAPVPCD